MSAHLIFAGVFLGAAAMASPSEASQCPTNTLKANQVTISTADSVAEYGNGQECSSWLPGYGVGFASYDLVLGQWRVSAEAGGECSGTASLATHDVFTLVGPGGDQSIEFGARLDVESDTFTGVTLREGESNEQSSVPGTFRQTIEVRIQRAVGESFDLHVLMGAGADHNARFATATAALTFPDLPAGYAVASCQGYISDIAVPAGAVSWGRIKSMYR